MRTVARAGFLQPASFNIGLLPDSTSGEHLLDTGESIHDLRAHLILGFFLVVMRSSPKKSNGEVFLRTTPVRPQNGKRRETLPVRFTLPVSFTPAWDAAGLGKLDSVRLKTESSRRPEAAILTGSLWLPGRPDRSTLCPVRLRHGRGDR